MNKIKNAIKDFCHFVAPFEVALFMILPIVRLCTTFSFLKYEGYSFLLWLATFSIWYICGGKKEIEEDIANYKK